VFGEGVAVASKIAVLGEGGEICISAQVYDNVKERTELEIEKFTPRQLIDEDLPEVFKIVIPREKGGERTMAHEEKGRVAILPFSNISPDPSDQYFADGLTEELISTISKISELRVISRTSVMQYKDRSKPIGEIGRELKAGTILEGSVRKAGNRIRVTVQMIDAIRDIHRWVESYDRELQDIFAIQSDIAQRVAAALRVQLRSSEKRDIETRPTESVEAYQLYLKGRYHFNQDRVENYAKALRYLEEATKLDPRFALAYAGISDYYHVGSHYNWFSPEDAFPKMKDFATKALGINPRLAEGHAALGAVYFHYEWKWQDAEKEFTHAIELKPSYDYAYHMYSYLLAIMGRFEESYEQAKLEAELSPEFGARGWGSNLAFGMLRLGKIGEGITHLEKIVKADPEFATAHRRLGFAYYQASRIEDAISEMRKAVALSLDDPSFKADLAVLLALAGQKEGANSLLNGLKEASKTTYVSNVQMACILYSLGRQDEAFDNLEKAYERRAIDLPDVRLMPYMSALRAEPRWISIESRMGLREL
jgi:TolB-like protein/Flp pilus assembly protein TadD